MTDILRLEHLTKQYPRFLLDDVSFSLPQGYIMGLIGANGAGKSTIIKLILNMIKRDQGRVELFGKELLESEYAAKQRVGIVFDSNYFIDEWKVKSIGNTVGKFYEKWDEQTYLRYLDEFEINSDKTVKDLSRGMQMKLMLAFAFSHDAELLVLDEPTSGLDAPSRDQLMEILSDFIADGDRSVLFSTHITDDLEKIADYISFIKNGKLMFCGEKNDFLHHYIIVKGGPNDLDDSLRQKLFGLRSYETGFEAMAYADDRALFDRFQIEQPSIDDIIVYSNRKEGKRHV